MKQSIKYAAAAVVAAGTLAMAAGYAYVTPTNNLTRHLPNSSPECLSIYGYPTRQFLRKYGKEIIGQSGKYKIHPLIIAAAIAEHNDERRRWLHDILDDSRTAIIKISNAVYLSGVVDYLHNKAGIPNHTVGAGQIRLNTARNSNERFGLPRKTLYELVLELENPATNPGYTAREMVQLVLRREGSHTTRDLRNGNYELESVLKNPRLLSVAYTEFRKGKSPKILEEAYPSHEHGIRFLRIMLQLDSESIFGEQFRLTEEQRKIIESYIRRNGFRERDVVVLDKAKLKECLPSGKPF